MTVSTFTQPDYTNQLGSTYPTNIDSCVNVLAQIGQDFAPHAASSPNLTVLIDAGKIIKADGTLVSQAQQTATFVAPAANPRIDRIVIDMLTGAYSIIAGTEAASPTAPAITAGKLPCAQVSLTVGITQITNALITDERTAFVGGFVDTASSQTVSGSKTWTGAAEFDAAVNFSQAVTSDRAAVSGFTRVTPNLCRNDSIGFYSNSLSSGTVAAVTPSGLPASGLKSLVLSVVVSTQAANAVGQRIREVTFYSDSAGTYRAGYAACFSYEHVAVTGSTQIGRNVSTVIVPCTGSGTFYYSAFGSSGSSFYEVIGYFD